jgi:hypothetical protein
MRRYWAATALCGALLLAAQAPAADPGAGRRQVAIDAKLLEAYAGTYSLHGSAVLTVRRQSDHLQVQLTGQPAAPVYPQSATSFFAKAVDAQFTFERNAAGKVSDVRLQQNGADVRLPRIDAETAREISERIAARVEAQKASPGTEAAVRALDASLAAGKPDYGAMTPAVAAAIRKQLPKLQQGLAGLGPIEDVRFLGVNAQGADVYDVRHAKGVMHWTVALAPDGKIAAAWVIPGP